MKKIAYSARIEPWGSNARGIIFSMIGAIFGLLLFPPLAKAQSKLSPDYLESIAGEKGEVQTAFDADQAMRMLEPGTSTITGQTYARAGLFRREYGQEMLVLLLPMTAFMQEWCARWGGDPGPGIQYLPSKIRSYAATAITDSEGNFTIQSLLPGKYVLLTEVSWTQEHRIDNVVGQETGYNVYGTPLYTRNVYGQDIIQYGSRSRTIMLIVDIHAEGESINLGRIK